MSDTALEMLDQCAAEGQSARRVVSSDDADALRELLRQEARGRGLRIRTARMDEVVVVVRVDAELWRQDAATMRAKLTPPDDAS